MSRFFMVHCVHMLLNVL